MMTLGMEVMDMKRAFLPHISGSKNTSVQVVLSSSHHLARLGSCSPDHRFCQHITNPTHVQ